MAESGYRRWTVQCYRRKLPRESLNRGFVGAAHCEPQDDLRNVRRRLARHLAMTCICSYEFGAHRVELEAHPGHSFTQDEVSRLGLFVGIGPRIDQGSDSFMTRRVTDRDFIELGRWPALNAAEPHSIGRLLFEM